VCVCVCVCRVVQFKARFIVCIRLMASFPGQPGQACHRKTEPFWVVLRQGTLRCQWHQLDHVSIIFTLYQTDNHSCTSSVSVLTDCDALSDAQPSRSKHSYGNPSCCNYYYYYCRMLLSECALRVRVRVRCCADGGIVVCLLRQAHW